MLNETKYQSTINNIIVTLRNLISLLITPVQSQTENKPMEVFASEDQIAH